MVINDSLLDEILNYLDNSISGLAIQQDFTHWNDLKNFLDGQYDIRLDNLLLGKSSSIHHLESGLKNKVIMRKRSLLDKLEKEFEKK
jgi:hypothetical protein